MAVTNFLFRLHIRHEKPMGHTLLEILEVRTAVFHHHRAGPVVALAYRVTVDVPALVRNSKAVGAVCLRFTTNSAPAAERHRCEGRRAESDHSQPSALCIARSK